MFRIGQCVDDWRHQLVLPSSWINPSIIASETRAKRARPAQRLLFAALLLGTIK